ncbi:hypothetical protein [Streptomyces microflavus]|uniref:hypothetical protein n=1 Tax=Streptomyces microflavus TaxID=1919 RepID=UPI0033DD7EC3
MPQKASFPPLESLPSGPIRNLTANLRALHEDAGSPSFRRVQEAIEEANLPDTASHERIRQILMGESSGARWERIESIVRVLAAKAHPRRDPDLEVARFLLLWRQVFDAAVDTAPPDAVATSTPAGDLVGTPPPDQDLTLPPASWPGFHLETGNIPQEVKNAAALLSPDDLVSLHRRLAVEVGESEAVKTLKVIGRLRNPYAVIEIVEKFRKSSLHKEATIILQEAVASWSIRDVEDLVQLFWKEGWQIDTLIEAIAVFRSAEEVARILHLMDQREEAETLKRKFAELRDDAQVEELDELLGGN